MENSVMSLITTRVSIALIVCSCCTGCSTWDKLNQTEKGAVIGAGGGAVVGGAATGSATGAAVGGALGGVAGGVIGHERDDD